MGSTTIRLIVLYVFILGIMFVPMYLRNKKKNKETKQMMDSLQAGTKIVTIGGIHGVISEINEATIDIKVDKQVKLTISKGAISRVVK